MPRSLPPLNALRAFEAAGRLGSFTKAAKELNVSHSAISRHVRGLEQRLNVHLFRSENIGVALTDQGHSYLAEITPAFDQIAQATEMLSVPPEGAVTLTTESTIAQKWLVPRLANLKKLHPDIDLRLSVATQVMDIEAHDFDVGLRYLRSDPPAGYDLLFPSIVRAYAAPGFAPINNGALDLMSLAKGPLVEEATFRIWPEWFKMAGLEDVPDLDLPHPLSALLAIQSAVAGLGAVLMDECLCEPEVQSGALVELSDVEIPFGGYYLAVNSRAGRRKAVRAVRQWLLDERANSEGRET
ncbi:LysR substrate-binding domain-containing protein [Pseudohalocynthiibacter aestuariivivens]|uniref:LysR substrate-binding domain-containing protein n=1 Tax=Pseudohalocynthiibacter aestuariivivens TaxID=1591409 RepID=A0ABV5JCB1_9RHOB|nr:LysR substrate-binding domain-containing protein [Pseudohalocynthiibacter aestuariivivens]MBS9718892.1 LysR family transcriptional regulator [Pseudohalocynthiibacter aestuariivivens]